MEINDLYVVKTHMYNSLIYSEKLSKIIGKLFGIIMLSYYLYYVIKMIKYEFKY